MNDGFMQYNDKHSLNKHFVTYNMILPLIRKEYVDDFVEGCGIAINICMYQRTAILSYRGTWYFDRAFNELGDYLLDLCPLQRENKLEKNGISFCYESMFTWPPWMDEYKSLPIPIEVLTMANRGV